MKENGYINATKLCKKANKEFKNWYKAGYAKKIINNLKLKLNTSNPVIMQNKILGVNEIRGTYVHPLLISNIANWISPDFALEMSIWVDEWKKMSINNENKYWNALSTIKPSFNNTKEYNIKLKLNKKLKGTLEVETDHGFIDILTKKEIIEVKIAKHYKYALGQILAYSIYYPKKNKIIYLFDVSDNIDIDKIIKLYDKHDVELRFYNDTDD
jgi:hypothetical protein